MTAILLELVEKPSTILFLLELLACCSLPLFLIFLEPWLMAKIVLDGCFAEEHAKRKVLLKKQNEQVFIKILPGEKIPGANKSCDVEVGHSLGSSENFLLGPLKEENEQVFYPHYYATVSFGKKCIAGNKISDGLDDNKNPIVECWEDCPYDAGAHSLLPEESSYSILNNDFHGDVGGKRIFDEKIFIQEDEEQLEKFIEEHKDSYWFVEVMDLFKTSKEDSMEFEKQFEVNSLSAEILSSVNGSNRNGTSGAACNSCSDGANSVGDGGCDGCDTGTSADDADADENDKDGDENDKDGDDDSDNSADGEDVGDGNGKDGNGAGEDSGGGEGSGDGEDGGHDEHGGHGDDKDGDDGEDGRDIGGGDDGDGNDKDGDDEDGDGEDGDGEGGDDEDSGNDEDGRDIGGGDGGNGNDKDSDDDEDGRDIGGGDGGYLGNVENDNNSNDKIDEDITSRILVPFKGVGSKDGQYRNGYEYTLVKNDEKLVNGKLGKGSYGTAHLIVDLKTDRRYVRKKILTKELKMEIEVMLRLDHPNIVKLLGAAKIGPHVYIIMTYGEDGTLTQIVMENKTQLPKTLKNSFCGDLWRALCYMQEKGIVHRDLKDDNIVVSGGMARLQLIDFGHAAFVPDGAVLDDKFSVYTYYTSPEIARGEPYSFPTDVWSLGGLCLFIFTEERPWASEVEELGPLIYQIGHRACPPWPEDIDPNLNGFFEKIFKPQDQRMTARGALEFFEARCQDDETQLSL